MIYRPIDCILMQSKIVNKRPRPLSTSEHLRDPLARRANKDGSPLPDQRIPRRGDFLKFARAAAGVRVRALGDMLVGPVDFRPGQTAAERQSKHPPVALLRRQRLRADIALAELRSGERVQGLAKDAEPAPRGVLDGLVGFLNSKRYAGSKMPAWPPVAASSPR